MPIWQYILFFGTFINSLLGKEAFVVAEQKSKENKRHILDLQKIFRFIFQLLQQSKTLLTTRNSLSKTTKKNTPIRLALYFYRARKILLNYLEIFQRP